MTRTGVECDIEQQNCEDMTCIFDSLWFHGTELFKVGKILANILTYDTYPYKNQTSHKGGTTVLYLW